PGNYEKDEWYFTPHNFDQVPDRRQMECQQNRLRILYYYLPSSTEHDNEPFECPAKYNAECCPSPQSLANVPPGNADAGVEEQVAQSIVHTESSLSEATLKRM
ncbi:hypothetical protein PQX77_014546, partial [Marasmius sp. AFHP31]